MTQSDVQVIIPARNEQDCIGRCLESLSAQQGIAFEIMVVDDQSSDRTAEIARSFPGVKVLSPPAPSESASGKCNALIAAAQYARTKWLLFTDADTLHLPGSLAAAVAEAEERQVDLLSYSPEQEVSSWSERILMPVVFADLAQSYPPEKVNASTSPLAAANGQYLLVRRAVYEQVGGHQAVAAAILEDVELARRFKSTGHRIWFRHGRGLVKTRMYRNLQAMVEGWTKNLALLFPDTLRLAAVRFLEFLVIVAGLLGGALLLAHAASMFALILMAAGALAYFNFLARIRHAHFRWRENAVAICGLPVFSWLLVRSYIHTNIYKAVAWKGRSYRPAEANSALKSSIAEGNLIVKG